MMKTFDYPCPDCRTNSNLHEDGCDMAAYKRGQIEAAYVEILSSLQRGPKTKNDMKKNIEWTVRHDNCLERLKLEYIVIKNGEDEDGNEMYGIVPEEERKDYISQPMYDPMKTVYEKGTVKGAHDNGVFAMVAFYQMVGFSWEETRDNVVEWLRESGAWDRGGFAESSPEELVNKKRHVYEEEYGWMEKGESAKRVIDEKV